MMKKQRVSVRDVIGLDIGESTIKVIRLKKSGAREILQNYGFFPTPKGALERGEIKDLDILEEALNECLSDARIKKGKGVLGLSGKDVVVRLAEFPIMSKEELREAVGWDLTQYISYPIEEAVYDYYILGTKEEKGTERLRVLVAAAPLELINKYIKLLSSLRITLIAIDIKPLALTRLSIPREMDKGANIIIDVGATTTSMVILRDGEFAYLRDVLLGGRDFTQAIQKGFSISEEEAEYMKKRIDTHPEREKIYSIISSVMDEFILEITRSLNYFKENIENIGVFNRLFFTGGGSKLSGFISYIESGIGIKAELLDALRGIKYGSSISEEIVELKDFFGVAIGLSKRGFEGE